MARHTGVAEVTGSVWKIEVELGEEVDDGAELVILESMKMEVPVYAPAAGKVVEILFKEGDAVEEGAVVVVIED